MSDRLDYLKSRYLYAQPYQTKGMELLRFFILSVDYSALDSYPNDIARFTDVIQFFKNSKLQAFDPTVNGKILGDKLFRPAQGQPPPEIWLNVEPKDPMLSYPFDKPWEDWQELRAVRLIYHDSLEMLDEFNNSLLNFKVERPTLLVVSLDVATLIFKYYKYWKACRTDGVAPNVNEYLKQYEYSHFYDDLFDIWLLNLMTYVFEHPQDPVDNIIDHLTIPVRVATTHMLTQGIEGLQEFISLVKEGALRPQDFLEIRWFANNTIKSRMEELDAWMSMPDRRQYLWCRTLLWLPYLRFIADLLHLAPEAGLTKLLLERANELYWRKFKYVNMPGIAYGEKLRIFVNRLSMAIEQILTNSEVTPE